MVSTNRMLRFEMKKLQANINDNDNPGLNGTSPCFPIFHGHFLILIFACPADIMGDGSVQSSTTPLSTCENDCDEPFYNTLSSELGSTNIVAIVSGHGQIIFSAGIHIFGDLI